MVSISIFWIFRMRGERWHIVGKALYEIFNFQLNRIFFDVDVMGEGEEEGVCGPECKWGVWKAHI